VAVGTIAVVVAALSGIAIGKTLRSSGKAAAPVVSTPASYPFGGSSGGSSQGSSVAAKVDPSVVDVNTTLGYQGAEAAGTGMVLSSSGEVLTNNHVVDGATSITATLVSTGRTYTAKVVGTDPSHDVAVIQLQGASGLKPIKVGDSSKVSQGDSVVAIGNAGGVGGAPSVVTGTVQAVGQSITASDESGANPEQLTGLIETDAPIQPGDSGGPLVNTAGQVIGMDTAGSQGTSFQSTATQAYAIPIDTAISVARQIESGKSSASVHVGSTAFLGVEVQSGSDSQGSSGLGGFAGLGGQSTAPTSGAAVAGVASGSPAEKAGLQQGDVITSFDGQNVDSAQTLGSLIAQHHPGDKVTVGWTDQSGQAQTATVTLATGPAN
jgi:S1-C subfamily serine protease